MNIKVAADLVPELGFDKEFRAVMPANYTLDMVVVAFPAYFPTLSALLQATPRETIQAYFLWHAIVALSDMIEAKELLPLKRFQARLEGTREFRGSLTFASSRSTGLARKLTMTTACTRIRTRSVNVIGPAWVMSVICSRGC